MAVALFILVTLYSGVATSMSLAANRRFARHARLPMQFWIDGRPTWSAPRRLALVIAPVLCGAGVIAGSIGMIFAPHRLNVPEGQAMEVVAGTGVLGIAIYALYLWLVDRWDRAGANQ